MMRYCLEPGELVSVGIRRLILEQIKDIQHYMTDIDVGWEVGVHESRKSCKRIRAAVRLIRDEIGKEAYKRENIRFRDIARKLAAARDSWVMVEVFDHVINEDSETLLNGEYSDFRGRLVRNYTSTLLSEQEDAMLIPEISHTLEDAVIYVSNLPFLQEGFPAIKGGLHRTYARGQLGLRKSISKPSPENFHEWRKRVKYLWHQVEILINIQFDWMTQYSENLHLLADILGDHHDLVVLRTKARESSDSFSSRYEQERLINSIEKKRLGLESQAESLGKKLYQASTGEFCGVLEGYWKRCN
jgi:CHAD domain-containing protein